jgi:para-aminobenzoate synthetase component 1
MTCVREIDWQDPAGIASGWRGAAPWAWLDSAGPLHERSRHSFLCRDPFGVIVAQHGRVTVDGATVPGDPFTVLQRILAPLRTQPAGPVPFGGGAVGFFGYELGGVLERLPRRHPDDLGIPDMAMMLFDVVLAFDHAARRAWIVSTGQPEAAGAARQRRAAQRLNQALTWLGETRPVPPVPRLTWRRELARPEYETRVRRVLDYIFAGDIFQANFTTRYLAERPENADPLAVYLALRAKSPAPFGAFLDCGPHLAIASASPERFLRLDAGGSVETRPIKGTMPRHPDAEEDRRLAEMLQASPKDRAENLMIVDLLRNDIGRVATIGSVRVPALWEVESFAAVHHLVSAVTATLAPGRDAVDLLRAAFPGGSVTGAPKIRAMEIIDELEAARRGPYCGAIGWLGFDGAMDTSIVIRTVVITPEKLVAQAGGGIVADSEPGAEYDEMLAKILPLLQALGEVAA